jgi:hypothetical protein
MKSAQPHRSGLFGGVLPASRKTGGAARHSGSCFGDRRGTHRQVRPRTESGRGAKPQELPGRGGRCSFFEEMRET